MLNLSVGFKPKIGILTVYGKVFPLLFFQTIGLLLEKNNEFRLNDNNNNGFSLQRKTIIAELFKIIDAKNIY